MTRIWWRLVLASSLAGLIVPEPASASTVSYVHTRVRDKTSKTRSPSGQRGSSPPRAALRWWPSVTTCKWQVG